MLYFNFSSSSVVFISSLPHQKWHLFTNPFLSICKAFFIGIYCVFSISSLCKRYYNLIVIWLQNRAFSLKKILKNYWPLFKSLIIIIITTSNNKAEIELYYEAVDFSSAEILVVYVKEEGNFVKTFFFLVPDWEL